MNTAGSRTASDLGTPLLRGRRVLLLVLAVVGGVLGTGAPGFAAGAADDSVTGAAFSSPQDGVVLLLRCRGERCHDALAVTADGGTTIAVTRRFTGASSGPLTAREVMAAGPGVLLLQDGARAYRSVDGGRHLSRVPLPGKIRELEAHGASAYATTQACDGCRLRFWHSFDGGRHWWYSTLRGPGSRRGWVDVTAIDDRRALRIVEHAAGAAEEVRSRLELTEDGGHRWRRLRHPCPVTDKGSHATSTDGREIWVGCNFHSGGGDVQRTRDGGRHWRSTVRQFRGDRQGSFGIGNFTVALEAIGPRAAVAIGRKSGVFSTRDGGRAWRASDGFDDGAWTGDLVHAGPRHAWAVVGGELRRTTDGARTWRRVPVRVRSR